MRRGVVAVGVGVLLATGVGLAGSSAQAAAPSVAFTADDLTTYQANGVVWALASTGTTVFAGGTFTAVRPSGAAAGVSETPAANLAVLNATTGAPTGCSISVTRNAGGATVRALNVSPDGSTLYVGGLFDGVNGTAVANLAAVDIASCTTKTTFRPYVEGYVRAIASTGSSVYVGGDFVKAGVSPAAPQTRNRAVAFDASGAVLPWDPNADLPVRAIAPVGDGRVLIGGDFNTVGGVTASHAIAAVNDSDGAVVHSFPGFFESRSVVKKIAVSGSAFYVGNEGTGSGAFDGRTAVSLTDYSQIWRDTCLGATQSVLPYNGVLYSASHAHDCTTNNNGEWGNGRRQHLVAQTLAGPETKLPWYPDTNDGIGEQIGPRDLTVAGGNLWVAGEFTTVNGHAQQSLTRFGTGPDKTKPSQPTLMPTSTDAGTVVLRWRPGVDTDDSTLTYKLWKNGNLTTPYRTFTADSSWWARRQQVFVDTGLPVGSTQSYRMTVTDGVNTSALTTPVTVTVSAGGGPGAYANAVLADSPNSYWRLDEPAGTLAADTTAANNSGQFSNVVTSYRQPGALIGQPNTGVLLNGSVSIANELPQPSPGSTFSSEAWFNTTTTTGGRIIGFSNSALIAQPLATKQVYMTNTGQLVFGLALTTSTASAVTSPLTYNDGQWHHVVATRDSVGLKLYVDGILVASNAVKSPDMAFPGFWRVGGDAVAAPMPTRPTAKYFTGAVDEVATYPVALSAAQVSAHYHASGR